MESVLFYVFSGAAILSALGVVILSKPTRALLCLILTMFALTGLFLLLGAYFVAMIHLIVYAGAVLVLFLFVIMLQGVGAKDISLTKRFHGLYLFAAAISGGAFLTMLLVLISRTLLPSPAGVTGSIEMIGESLFKNFLLPFELVSILLLLGVFAAVALAKREET